MKRILCFLLIMLLILTAGCGPESENTQTPTKVVATEAPVKPAPPVTEAQVTESPADEIAVDATAAATPAIPEGLCKACGEDIGDYDGYCYYCHPDFGFTCAKCGGFYPLHRPASGLCDVCDPPNS